jgi:hypothetical protein
MSLDRHPIEQQGGKAVPSGSNPTGAATEWPRHLDWRQPVGAALIVAGAAIIIVGWFGISGTSVQSDQLSYLASGGVGGAALIAIGIAVCVSYEHGRDRAALQAVLERLVRIEDRLDGDPPRAALSAASSGVDGAGQTREKSSPDSSESVGTVAEEQSPG